MTDQVVRVPVAIVGGGPAAAAMAHRLALAHVPALVIERTDGSGSSLGESLGGSINPVLANMGLEGALAESGPIPSLANLSCWGSATIEERHVLREPYGDGWHLDRPAFNRALLAAAQRTGAMVWRHAVVRNVAPMEAGGWQLTVTRDGAVTTVEAGLIADAGGRKAPVARRLGAHIVRDDQLAAVWTRLPRPKGFPNATFVEAIEHGWWYAAPVPDAKIVVALFSDPDIIATLRAWQPAGWLAARQLAPVLSTLLDETAVPDRVQIAAAGSSLLEPAGGEGWLAAGDAAAAHDPIASHGIGSALTTGTQAADALLATMAGDTQAIADYAARFAARHTVERQAISAVYGLERRWPNAPFWCRRHSSAH